MISVLDTPLFTVARLDGSRAPLGLRSVLLEAHAIRRIEARTPTGWAALFRLLTVFAEAAYHPATLKDRRTMLEAGRFDPEPFEAYIGLCARDGACFLLDDPDQPFMQAAYDAALDERAEKPVSVLLMDFPSGNNHVFWDHRFADAHAVSPAQALEAMLETYMFCPAGLSGPSNIDNTPPVFAFAQGETLFETLVLNMVSEEELGNIPFGAGDEPWRKRVVVKPRMTIPAVSYLEALTFRPRRVRLIFDDDGLIRRVSCQAGLDFRGDGRWKDPNVPYRTTKDGLWTTLKPMLGRGVWRDAAVLVAGNADNVRPPVPFLNIAEVLPDDDRQILMRAVALITKKEAVMGWLDEMLRIPEVLLYNGAPAEEFRAWLSFCEEINGLLRRAIGQEMTQECADQAGEIFLSGMKEAIFGMLLDHLISEASFGKAREERSEAFAKAIRRVLRDAFETVVYRSGRDIKSMRRQENLRGLVVGRCGKRLTEEGFVCPNGI